MKKLLMITLVAVSAFTACKMRETEKDIQPTEVAARESHRDFHAVLEGAGAQTKVYTDESLHVLWNKDDYISIFDKSTRNKKYHFKGADGATGGDFEYESAGYGTGEALSYSYGVYPYDERTGYVHDDIIRAYLPGSQAYKANSFGRDANLMVAKSSTDDLFFKNVGSFLCLKLYGAGYSVSSIILTGNNDETLSGPVKISFDASNIPSMVFDTATPDELKKTIVLSAETPVALGASEAEAVTFWMVVPPMELTGGFTVTIIDSEGGMHTKTTTKPVTFERNTQKPMKAFEVTAEALAPIPLGIHPIPGGGYTYDKTTDQENIYESEGQVWIRFLNTASVSMYEIGPLPASVAAGDRVSTAKLAYYENGVKLEEENLLLTVQSIADGYMNLVSADGVRFVVHF